MLQVTDFASKRVDSLFDFLLLFKEFALNIDVNIFIKKTLDVSSNEIDELLFSNNIIIASGLSSFKPCSAKITVCVFSPPVRTSTFSTEKKIDKEVSVFAIPCGLSLAVASFNTLFTI